MNIRKSLPYFLCMALLVVGLSSFTTIREDDKKDDLRTTWANTKAYVLAIAEAMPEDQYGFKPTDEIRDFAGQLKHISFSIYFLPGVFVEGKNIKFDPEYPSKPELVGGTKAEIIALLEQRFDAIDELLAKATDKQLDESIVIPFMDNKKTTKGDLMTWLNKHTGHHSSQAIIYLRMNGITPPAYNGW